MKTLQALLPNGVWIAAISALLSILLTLSSRWVFDVSQTQTAHAAAISRLDERTQNTDRAIIEIKTGQVRIEDKLDHVLERK